MSCTEENTIETFLIRNICDAIEEYNTNVGEVICEDDDIVLLEDGLNDNSILKIQEICHRMDRGRAPLKMIVLWVTNYLYNCEGIDLQEEFVEPAFSVCVLDDDDWYAYHQQSDQGIKALYWNNYLNNYSDKKYAIMDFRNGMVELLGVFGEDDNIDFDICMWLIKLMERTVESKTYLCTNVPTTDLQALKTRILAGIKLTILLSGKILHEIQEYTYQPLELTDYRGTFDYKINYDILSKSYEQFEQIYEVINEYNGTKGIIEKYLKLYQVLEELMVRINVVKFSKGKITVRALEEFKSIKSTERDSLRKLFENIFYVDSLANSKMADKKLLDEIKALWDASDFAYATSLNVQYNESKDLTVNFHDLLDGYKVNQVSDFYSFWIYELRCEIVHNKATEYHMTYMNLDENLKRFMIDFFLPSMEAIIFHTMIRVPKCLQYDRDAIRISLW